MKDKIEFLKWMISRIGYTAIFWVFHWVMIICMFLLPKPYDVYATYYVLSSIVVGAIYCLVLMPIKWAYIEFKRELSK